MTKEFRKQTEEAKFEAFSLMCKKVADLEKENTELKCECRRCIYTDSPCILSDYGKDKNGICDHFKDVLDENAELKEYNKYLRRKRQGGIQKQYNKVAIIKQQDEQLTKAKELLERFLGLGNLWNLDCKDYFPLRKEAEQFLSEVENV